ncbi:MAG TPA: protein-glutamine glutaminase family protein, partial [bacterium]|nr:protein-glutamine glutaminase family protein [bacterium]
LEISHARHVLKRANPEFDALLRALRDAQAQNAWLIVTETDDHEIIDVRPSAQPPEPREARRRSVLGDLWRWLKWLLRCLSYRCVKPHKAEQMFNLVSAQSCDPTTVPPPCIPFLYPDDGCWARAHEMCRLMIAAGVTPRKVWIFGSLYVPTRNNPACHVGWGWHVAPTLCIRHRFFGPSEENVIDPSLFPAPVSTLTWKGVQGDPNAQLKHTDASVYFHPSLPFLPKTDPTYTQTAQDLSFYRLLLKNRSLQFGPPPYANCP